MSWGIAETAQEIEKIKSESADYLNGLNSCGVIDWNTYNYAFDFYADLLMKAYEQGGKDAQPEIIRCKDCSKRPYCRMSTAWAVVPDDDWFCGDAERNLEEIPDTRGNRIEQPHWIPCSEKLPEANGRYLVTRGLNACGSLWKRVYIVNYSDLMGLKSDRIWWDGNVGKSDFERIEDVIAWMPLPEPYKEDTP